MASGVNRSNSLVNGSDDVKLKSKQYNESTLESSSHVHKKRFNQHHVNKCDPCSRGKISEEASMYCIECSECLCEDCVKHHLRNRSSSNHRLCKLEKGKDVSCKLSYINKVTKCKEHETKTVKYLCKEHDQLCCNECATVSHRQCQQLVSIDKEQSTDVDFKDAVNNLQELKNHAFRVLNHEYEQVTLVEEVEKSIKTAFKELRRELNSTLFAIEDKLKQDANQQRKAILGHIQKQISWSEDLNSSIERSEIKIAAVKEFGSLQEEYLLRRELMSDITKIAEKLAYLHINVTCEKPVINGIDEAREALQTCFGKSLSVKIIKDPTTDLPLLPQMRGMSAKNRSIHLQPKRQEITRPNTYTFTAGVNNGNQKLPDHGSHGSDHEAFSYRHPNFVTRQIPAASETIRGKYSNWGIENEAKRDGGVWKSACEN